MFKTQNESVTPQTLYAKRMIDLSYLVWNLSPIKTQYSHHSPVAVLGPVGLNTNYDSCRYLTDADIDWISGGS